MVLFGFSSDPVQIGDLSVEVGDLVGLDGYLSIDRSGPTGDREIAALSPPASARLPVGRRGPRGSHAQGPSGGPAEKTTQEAASLIFGLRVTTLGPVLATEKVLRQGQRSG